MGYQLSPAAYDLHLLKVRLRLAAQGVLPSIHQRRTHESTMMQQELGVNVVDWDMLKGSKGKLFSANMPRYIPNTTSSRAASIRRGNGDNVARGYQPKMSRAVKCKATVSGRTYTSKYRGVHQTFPTKRWEAQFRRNGKPTSLGCFDEEEEAARAYDKMMLWCELHATAGVRPGMTNFELAEYDQDVEYLRLCTQVKESRLASAATALALCGHCTTGLHASPSVSASDELLDTLRCNGRRQAARRGASRRDGTEQAEGEQESDEDMGYGAGGEGSPAAAAGGGMSHALAGGGIDFFQTAEMGGSRSSRPPSH
ncbi:MAG: hypothetical protein WDW36_000975 [Sanguina aurantia]